MSCPPNTWSCDVAGKYDNQSGTIGTAGSRHPGSVNLLVLDGSTRSIKSSISRNVWWALGTKSMGEVISAGDFRSPCFAPRASSTGPGAGSVNRIPSRAGYAAIFRPRRDYSRCFITPGANTSPMCPPAGPPP